MAEAQRGLRVYLITEEQYSILTGYLAHSPDGELQSAVDLIGGQSIGMLPAADMGNQGERQAQFEKYRAAIAAAIGGVEPGLVEQAAETEPNQRTGRQRYPDEDAGQSGKPGPF